MIIKNDLKVSVIMNVHNGEKYICHSIKSVIKQSYTNWELVIWDNISTDKTYFLINKFKDLRIRYFKSNTFDNLYAARNKAIGKARGALITFLDVDDLWLPNKLDAQIKIMVNPSIDFCYSNFYLIGEKGLSRFSKKAFNFLPSGKIYKKLISSYKVGILTLCIRRETLLKKNIFFDSRFSIIGDMILVLELSKLGTAFGDQRCLACYRIHGNNLSRKVLLQVKEMRIWFNDLKFLGNWNEKDFKSLISLVNYKRAKGLSDKLSIIQIIKITLQIKNLYLIIRFLAFYFLRVLSKLFIHKTKKKNDFRIFKLFNCCK